MDHPITRRLSLSTRYGHTVKELIENATCGNAGRQCQDIKVIHRVRARTIGDMLGYATFINKAHGAISVSTDRATTKVIEEMLNETYK